jgi:hypothetical protein
MLRVKNMLVWEGRGCIPSFCRVIIQHIIPKGLWLQGRYMWDRYFLAVQMHR